MKIFALIFLFGMVANAGLSNGSVVADPNGNLIDPRTRTWNLLNTTDSVNAAQSGSWAVFQNGTWTTGRTWSLLNSTDSVNAVQSGTWTVTQGSANTLTNGWPVKIIDGTDSAEVKAASTPATAADTALVVAINPGTPVSTKTALTANSPTVASVGTSSASAVASNASRKGLILQNNSVNTIYLGIGATAVIGSGITLYPGGVFNMDEFMFFTGAVNAIASGAASSMAIQEFQ